MRTVRRSCTAAVGTALLAVSAAAGPALADDSYTVQPGDNPWSVATAHGVGWLDLLHLNGLDIGSVIQPGQQLVLRQPAPAPTPSPTPSVPPAAPKQQGLFSITITIPPANQQATKASTPAAPAPAPAKPLTSDEVRDLVRQTATRYGVDPDLAAAVAQAESGLHADAVSPAGALGPLQVMPANTDWASSLAGHRLDLSNTADSVEAGVAILRWLGQNTTGTDELVAAYRQGLASVQSDGIHPDTAAYVAQVEQQLQGAAPAAGR